MSYVEFRLVWSGMTAPEQAAQVRSRATEDYYWHYKGAAGLLFSALFYPSALEICRYNFGRNLLEFALPSQTTFKIMGTALEDFINYALNCQAIVSEGHLRDPDWLIPFQRNDSVVLQLDKWERVTLNPVIPPLPYNIGLYHYLGSQPYDWLQIARDFVREQSAFAQLAQEKLRQGLEVAIIKQAA